MTPTDTHLDPRAREALRDWLRAQNLSNTKFAAMAHIDRVDFQTLLNGSRLRMSLIMAYRIHHATGGAIAWYSWVPWAIRRETEGSG